MDQRLAVPGGGLLVANAFLHFPVEIVVAREAQFHGGFDKGVADRVGIAASDTASGPSLP